MNQVQRGRGAKGGGTNRRSGLAVVAVRQRERSRALRPCRGAMKWRRPSKQERGAGSEGSKENRGEKRAAVPQGRCFSSVCSGWAGAGSSRDTGVGCDASQGGARLNVGEGALGGRVVPWQSTKGKGRAITSSMLRVAVVPKYGRGSGGMQPPHASSTAARPGPSATAAATIAARGSAGMLWDTPPTTAGAAAAACGWWAAAAAAAAGGSSEGALAAGAAEAAATASAATAACMAVALPVATAIFFWAAIASSNLPCMTCSSAGGGARAREVRCAGVWYQGAS